MAFEVPLDGLLDVDETKSPYTTDYSRWYQSYPYVFSHTNRNNGTSQFFLPIAPNNISVTTQYATSVVTTLYGTVEEHSEVRYFDIAISGNTGFAPQYVASRQVSKFQIPTDGPNKKAGRKSFDTGLSGTLSKTLGGFLPEITNTIAAAANLIADSLGGPTNKTGIDPELSGYAAFHNLYKFFLRYKEDTSGVKMNQSESGAAGMVTGALKSLGPKLPAIPRASHPLKFLNYKDGVAYDVVPISFTLTRSAENPLLYNYSIRLRGFNLQNVDTKIEPEDLLNQLGLDGQGGSIFSKISKIAGNASTLLSGIGRR